MPDAPLSRTGGQIGRLRSREVSGEVGVGVELLEDGGLLVLKLRDEIQVLVGGVGQ